MKKSRKRKGKPSAAKSPETTTLSREDKLTLLALFVGFVALLTSFYVVAGIRGQRSRLEHRLEAWRAEYHLSDAQVENIREIEMVFHGTGNPFFAKEETGEEVLRHNEKISRAMNPDDGERFLKSMVSKKEK